MPPELQWVRFRLSPFTAARVLIQVAIAQSDRHFPDESTSDAAIRYSVDSGGFAEVASMVQIGNHLKMNIPRELRDRTRDFYGGLLGCASMASPSPDLDLYEFAGGFVLGLFFGNDADTISEADHLRATWLELKVDDPAAWKARLIDFGVRRVEYPDATRFFFQAPGGQVFRLAPIDGGI